jgi:DNA transposition AAA+ family ATPase
MANLKERLEAHLACGVSQESAARAMGITGGVLSAWRKGRYSGDNERVTKLVEEYLRRQEDVTRELSAFKKDFDFVSTSVFRDIETGVRLADLRGEIRVIVGASGLGKTTALKRMKAGNETIVFVEPYRGIRNNRFMDKLSRAAGVQAKGSFGDYFEALVEHLSGSGRTIIVDEAENLPLQALDALRRINDFTGCGVVLCGMPSFLINLKAYQRDYGYIYNRTSIPVVLRPLTGEDIEAMTATMIERIVAPNIWHDACHGVGRDLRMIVQETMRVADLNSVPATDTDGYVKVIKTVTAQLGRIYA